MEPQESERFEEGKNSDFQDAEETAVHSRELPEVHDKSTTETVGGWGISWGIWQVHHYENAWRGYCLKRLPPPATRHSGEGLGPSSSNMTNPPHISLEK